MKNTLLLTLPNFKTAGSQHVVISLYQHYKNNGNRVYILIEDLDGYFPETIDPADRLVLHKSGYLGITGGLKYSRKLSRLINSRKINAVHSWDYRSEIWEAVACKWGKVPYVFTKKNNAWSKKWWIKSALATCIAYDQPEMANRFFSNRFLKNKSAFIPHGINTALFSPTQKVSKPTGIIGCIGNIGENKNQLLILQALAACSTKPKCVFYGNKDAAYFSILNRFISENNLENYVVFHEYVSNNELPEVIQKLDMLILASFNEGLPVTLLEAIACGTYCLASESGGGTKYILDVCKTGALFNPTDFHQLAGLIDDYYRQTTEKETIAANAIGNVRLNFSAAGEANKYLKLFKELIN